MDEARFLSLALANETNRAILDRLPELDLPDTWLVSGSLFQAVWNGLTGRAPDYGIKDYDIFYFDPDTSWEAEDRAIARARKLYAPLGIEVELRNQARVHLWYPGKFGMPYPPLSCATDGIDRFLAPACMVGVQATGDGVRTYAPFGFGDIATMTIRPNPVANFNADRLAEKASRWKENWPELTIVECNQAASSRS
ncbi:MAG: nucleotidyltransferase family protein [Parvibaculum sp.]|uniref:nucleotidyltransferase family protein n=1 Tax=Parvibaculum sp. TaxID=2024848 RepID=UPI0027256868|nr:nucleotidyltransferase family protein [Parvibaculum sp.]MDO8838738.1 nucleotidyltransferase family protein [Parvibaculum sp.]